MKKISVILLAVLLVSLVIFGGCAGQPGAPGKSTDLTMIGATVGSGTYALNLGMAEMWNKHVQKPYPINVSVRSYQAITETFKALGSGQTDITWAPIPFEFLVSKGIGPYQPTGKQAFYKLFAGGQAVPFVITTDPNIKTIADLKGKKVAGKKTADPNLDDIRTAYFAANGMTDDDVKLIEFNAYTESVRMVKDGTADAGMFLSSALNPAVEELALSKTVYFVPISDSELKSIQAKGPYWYKAEIAAGTYKGQDSAVQVASHREGVYVGLDFDQKIAYEMMKAIYDNFDEFTGYHSTAKYWDIKAASAIERIFQPFAPGSVKYFKEKGVWTDEHEEMQKILLDQAGL